MNAIAKMFRSLEYVSHTLPNADEYEKIMAQKEDEFVKNNPLCNLIKAYSNVFESGNADNGVSTVIEKIKKGQSVAEIMQRRQI